MELSTSLSLLLVEPSRAQYQILKGRLAAYNITDVRHVKTGAAALKAVAEEAPGLVISAMHLPDMTGAALAGTLRSQSETEEVLFALLSSERAAQFLEPIRQAGVIAILKKPLQPSQLEEMLLAVRDMTQGEELDFEGYIDEVRVLMVDDSRTARRFMRQVLVSIGVEQISETDDGSRAVEILEAETFDLIVTDLHMPEMNGMELATWIRTQSLRPEVPIIMATSEQDPGRRAQALESGVSALIDKPFAPAAVRALLEELLEVG